MCAGRDDDFERTKKTDFKGEYHGMKEEPVVSSHPLLTVYLYLSVSVCECLCICPSVSVCLYLRCVL